MAKYITPVVTAYQADDLQLIVGFATCSSYSGQNDDNCRDGSEMTFTCRTGPAVGQPGNCPSGRITCNSGPSAGFT